MSDPHTRIPVPDFTDRFRVIRALGQGGMGTVYLVYDRMKRMEVALKTISNMSATKLYRFKREFRSLVDLKHQNLAAMYELLSHEDAWFFTMEFLAGRNFLAHLHRFGGRFFEGSVHSEDETADLQEMAARRARKAGDEEAREEESHPAREVKWDEVRPALLQLVDGLQTLHDAGHIHCDIKPSNVIVTPEDRLVILDFGLVNPTEADVLDRKTRTGPEGTSGYIPPERFTDAEVTAAVDWYAVGAMLYELLTGSVPAGTSLSGLQSFAQSLSPTLFPSDAPADLVGICIELLAYSPGDRPSGDDLRRRLGDERRRSAGSSKQAAWRSLRTSR